MFNKKKEKKYDLFDAVNDLLGNQKEIIDIIEAQQEAIKALSESVEVLQKLAKKKEL